MQCQGRSWDYRAVVGLPSTPYAVVRYDAFGRTRGVIAEDHSVTWTSYHSLSTDVCDPLDNDPSSPFYRSCSTTIVDGHGRTIDQILRNVEPDSGDTATYHLWSYYRADGSVVGLVRANGGERPDWYTGTLPAQAVVRTFDYDRLGRRVSSNDPDTDNPDNGSETTNSWRYLYNKVDDLVAVRDPRGCGQNFFYDNAGRLRGEQYVSCTEAQTMRAERPAHTATHLVAWAWAAATVTLDVLYSYDATPTWVSSAPTGPTLGRATGVADRGQRAAIAYDERGNAIWTARQMAVISAPLDVVYNPLDSRPEGSQTPPSQTAVTYDDDHTYVREAEFDHAGRPTRIALPEDPDYDGTPPVIEGVLTYNARGLPATASLEIDEDPHPIVSRIEYLRDGLVSRIVYGSDPDDPDATQSTTVYDVRRRPIRMTTTREPGVTNVVLDNVSIVVDQQLAWDAANNLTAIVDHRDPEEWPAGHLPQSTLIRHDGLYRVTHADYEYTQTDGSRSSPDDGTDWRTAFGSADVNDPMYQEPAPSAAVTPSGFGGRVVSQTWSWDFLANQTESTDDEAVFYERSLGAITNGFEEELRPSALYLATNLDGGTGNGAGWVEADYGISGNLVAALM